MVHTGGCKNLMQTDDFFSSLCICFRFLRLLNYNLFWKLLMVERFNVGFTDSSADEFFRLTADSMRFLAHALTTS